MKIRGITAGQISSTIAEYNVVAAQAGKGYPAIKWLASGTPKGEGKAQTHAGWLVHKSLKAQQNGVLSKGNGAVINNPCRHVVAAIAMRLFAAGANQIIAEKITFVPTNGSGYIRQRVGNALAARGLNCYCLTNVSGATVTADAPVAAATIAAPVAPKPIQTHGLWPILPALEGELPAGETTEYKGTARAMTPAVTSLYVLFEIAQAIEAAITEREYKTLGSNGPGTKPTMQWNARAPFAFRMKYEEFTAFKKQFEARLARNFFDYIVLSSMQEAQHSSYVKRTSDAKATAYDPRTVIPVLSKVFHKTKWQSMYGGPAWGKIIDAAKMFFTMKDFPILFADHVVDLVHNTGCAFNKGYVIYGSSSDRHAMQPMLDAKRNGSLLGSKLNLTIEPEVMFWLGAWRSELKGTPVRVVKGTLPEPAKGTFDHDLWEMDATDWRMETVGGLQVTAKVGMIDATTHAAPIAWGTQTFRVSGALPKGLVADEQPVAATATPETQVAEQQVAGFNYPTDTRKGN